MNGGIYSASQSYMGSLLNTTISIPLDDVTAATVYRCQCAHHTPIQFKSQFSGCGLSV